MTIKEEIKNILDDVLGVEEIPNQDWFQVTDKDEAVEKIFRFMNYMCCENCRYGDSQHCSLHFLEIPDMSLLKCKDFEGGPK